MASGYGEGGAVRARVAGMGELEGIEQTLLWHWAGITGPLWAK